jgi:hypothetical protein
MMNSSDSGVRQKMKPSDRRAIHLSATGLIKCSEPPQLIGSAKIENRRRWSAKDVEVFD